MQFAMHEDQPYHKSCYKDFFHPKCDVCKNFVSAAQPCLWQIMELLVRVKFLLCELKLNYCIFPPDSNK
jgi:hypothetical protein